jgi:hypothetical protein
LIDDTAITGKVSLPENIAQNNYSLLTVSKHPARRGLRFERREEIRRNVRAANALGFRTDREIETVVRISRYRIEDLSLLRVIIVLGSFRRQVRC